MQDITTPSIHPSIITARSLLLSILPSPLPYSIPSLPTNILPAHQQILLIAISNLSPSMISQHFTSLQLKQLPPAESKILLEYQSSPDADLRLVLLPIAILRARIVQAQHKGLQFDITRFITSTLSQAKIFGIPLDPDAWEMPENYWDEWEHWFPRGREYCDSFSKWRRRDGHVGCTVVEMILGLEPPNSRRNDAIGRPPGLTF